MHLCEARRNNVAEIIQFGNYYVFALHAHYDNFIIRQFLPLSIAGTFLLL